ncbi:MAG: DUF4397 domain-containing protein [Gemmatimonadaceae bacterium]
MKVHRLLALGGLAVVAAGCGNDDNGTTSPSQNVAYVRYVNAMPDTSAVDFRFVDAIENSPIFVAVDYRQYTPYQATGAGPRHIKVFMDPNVGYRPDSSQIIAKQFLVDTTLTFEPNTYYTILHAGFARQGSPKQRFYVLKDALPAEAGGKISLRTINALFGFGSADVFATPDTDSTGFDGSALEQNVPELGPTTVASAVTTWRTLDTVPRSPRTNSYTLWVRKAGMATPAAGDSLFSVAPARISSDTSFANAVAGTQVDKTALTEVLLPPTLPCGCPASRSTFTKPGILFMVDRSGRKP